MAAPIKQYPRTNIDPAMRTTSGHLVKLVIPHLRHNMCHTSTKTNLKSVLYIGSFTIDSPNEF